MLPARIELRVIAKAPVITGSEEMKKYIFSSGTSIENHWAVERKSHRQEVLGPNRARCWVSFSSSSLVKCAILLIFHRNGWLAVQLVLNYINWDIIG